jgi:AAA domain-containing protein/primase-like protein/TOTE conflict system primase-like protein
MTLPIALLAPLVSRVRTDVHWKKGKGAPPFMVKVPLTDEYLHLHLTGGTARGVCPIKAGESTTRVAVLDLDSHKGETSWAGMGTAVESLRFTEFGLNPIVFSSSGGKGIHVYLVWDEPQDAYSVRSLLRTVLDIAGFTDGAGGVAKGQIEIYPRQDSVHLDGFGNMFILPYSGESVPLEPMADYQRMPRDYPVQWPVSSPVPVVQKPEPVERSEPQGLDERLMCAVGTLDPDMPYTDWVKVGQAIHHETEGSNDGLLLWDDWSTGGADYPGFEELEAKWDTFGRSSAAPVTGGTLYKMATGSGWVDTATADDFEDISMLPQVVDAPNPLRFAVVKPSEFHAVGSPGWFIKGVLPVAMLAVFYGASGTGKSFFSYDMVCAVARGIPWRGRRVKQARVVYIVAEGSGGFRNRVKAYATRHGIADDAMDDVLGIIPAAPNFLEKKDIRDVIAAVQAFGTCSIIVVDTWAQVTPGANENSGEDMGKALSHCRALSDATGAMVVLVHHSGKDAAKGARGWSGLRAAADCELEVVRDGDSRTATITKLKDGDDSPAFGFKLAPVPVGVDEDGDAVTSCVVEEAEVSVVSGGTNQDKKRRMGDNERLLSDTLQDYFERENEWPTIDTLVNETVEKLPESNTKVSVRRVNLRNCLDKMIGKEVLAIENGFVSVPEEQY